MLVKKEFVVSMIRIISDNNCKVQVETLIYNETYSFMYDIEITAPRQFPNLKAFNINNFHINTSVTISCNCRLEISSQKGQMK